MYVLSAMITLSSGRLFGKRFLKRWLRTHEPGLWGIFRGSFQPGAG